MKIGDFVLIRSVQSGVHAGYTEAIDGDTVTLRDSRRIWYWSGAASLSQLAMEGAANPGKCKFAVKLPEIIVLGVCEIIPCTDVARAMIEGCTEWRS